MGKKKKRNNKCEKCGGKTGSSALVCRRCGDE